MNLHHCIIGTFFFLAAAATVSGGEAPDQANLRGESGQTRKRLSEAEQKLITGKTADALDDIQRILDEAGSDLISIDGLRFQTTQQVANRVLSRLPAADLKNYQDQIETPARLLLEAGRRARSPEPLRQLVNRYFVSRPAGEGLLLLGDLLFERGEFHSAEQVWRRLLPDGEAEITHPNSRTDPALVRARIVLAVLFAGDAARAKIELKTFLEKHPTAAGNLAGKEGKLSGILTDLFKGTNPAGMVRNTGQEWTEFGGGPDHSASLGIRFPAEWSSVQPARVWSLESTAPAGPPHFAGRSPPPTPYGHPVVVQGKVFVTNGVHLCGYDLATERKFDPLKISSTVFAPSHTERLPTPCPSLTAAEGKLYARTGPLIFRAGGASFLAREDEKSYLICFELNPALPSGVKELWRIKAPVADGKQAVWEGAPVVSGRRLWAAFVRFENGRVVHGIACYDPADPTREPERPAWVVEVCDSSVSPASETRTRQELVTLAGNNIVFCSNAGAVVALDASTGRRAWAFRYPRSQSQGMNVSSDPTPPIAYAGRVFVAPADGRQVYCFDQETGNLLWESDPVEGVQLIGVSSGKLFLSSLRHVSGIRGLNIANGSYLESKGGWPGEDKRSFALGHGRGFVTEDAMLLSISYGLFVYKSSDGNVRPSHFGLPGSPSFVNVVFADGKLIAVSSTHACFYTPDSDDSVGQNAGSDETQLKFQRLISQAERQLVEGQTLLGKAILLNVARGNFPRGHRAWAAARLLLLEPPAREEANLSQEIRSVLPDLLNEWLIPATGPPLTLRALLNHQIGHDPPNTDPVLTNPGADETPSGPHGVSSEARVKRTTRLPPGAAPLELIPGGILPTQTFVVSGNELRGIAFKDGSQTRFATEGLFTHAAEVPSGIVLAGGDTIALYDAQKEPVWAFHLPQTPRLPRRIGDAPIYAGTTPAAPRLMGFRLCGELLVSLLGDQHVLGIDLKGRTVTWVQGTDRKASFDPQEGLDPLRFGSAFTVTPQFLAIRLSNAERWILHTRTGRVLELPCLDRQTSALGWPQCPTRVERNQLVFPDGAGTIRLVNVLTQRVKWTFGEPKRESSLTGVPPQSRRWGEQLLVAVSRNHGVEIESLSWRDGKPLWREGPAFLDADRVRLDDADADEERVYVTTSRSLSALDRGTGKTAWEAELPDLNGGAGWVARSGSKCVLVYPREAIPRESIACFLQRAAVVAEHEPFLWRLPGVALGLYDAWVTRTVPLLFLDPETGRVLNRIEVAARGPAVQVRLDNTQCIVATGDRVCWVK